MKNMTSNHWYSVRGQSLAVYARNSGFDLAIYDEYSDEVQQELRDRSIKEAIKQITNYCWENYDFDISECKKGVYVICLASPLSIQYQTEHSPVIYIGQGNIINRIESHFKKSLFGFMQSLSGADFDFYFARPTRKGPSQKYYKHVEYLMLEYFYERYGGIDQKKRFPILNKNNGSNKKYTDEPIKWWNHPLTKHVQRNPLWKLSPTINSDFAPLDDD